MTTGTVIILRITFNQLQWLFVLDIKILHIMTTMGLPKRRLSDVNILVPIMYNTKDEVQGKFFAVYLRSSDTMGVASRFIGAM